MRSLLKIYQKQLVLICCFFMVSVVFSQQSRNDSIAKIKQLQNQAAIAMQDQDFDTAIVSLIEAEKILSEGDFKDLKLE